MAYRNEETALRARIERSTLDLAALDSELPALRTQRDAARKRVESLRQRLTAVGQGGGKASARRDRIDVAAWVLVLVCVPLLYFHFDWHRYVAHDVSVIPAILWLGAPGLLAFLVAVPYQSVSRSCRLAAFCGAVFVLVPLLNVAIGLA